MSEYIDPIEEISQINDDECLAGYRAGLGFTAVDYTQKSASYWHGYRNGQADRGYEPPSPQSQKFARQIVAEGRAKGMH